MHQKLQLTSASGIISLLDDNLSEMKIFALDKLNNVVDEFWAEISDVIGKIEVLYEDQTFPHRNLAALVASKVYYHLGSFEDSLTYALGAGELFNVNCSNEYVDTIISKSIDYYTKARQANANAQSGSGSGSNQIQTIDPRLEDIVNRMFQRCFNDGQFKQAIGIALETRRMDMFEKAILQSGDLINMLAYGFKITMSLIDNLHYRNEVLKILNKLYKNLQIPDYISMTQCLIFLDDDKSLAELLDKLTRNDEQTLLAYQIAFDLYESATQQFLSRIMESLRLIAPIASLLKTNNNQIKDEKKSTDDTSASASAAASSDNKMETDEAATTTTPKTEETKSTTATKTEPKLEDLSPEDRKRQDRIEKLAKILTGDISIELDLQFLIRNNHTDLLILKNTKDAVRNSVCHNATVISNGFMHCGTTSDQFLRDNLDWLSRAVNWAKFSATASLGVIHKRHEKEALHLMSSYLPKDNGPGSGYTEGGGLFALGLIHANHGGPIIDYLLNQLKGATNEAVKHGGCLGLGLAAMGTHRNDVYEQLKYNLYQDDAVTGEAAGIAMGLVMLGSKSQIAIQDMVSYAQETQHEKILRGLSIGISLIMFSLLEEADSLIETLCQDKDPLLRRSGMHTVAMAYCGTGNNKAIRKLLHVAVSDVNDDVRRAAVEALGFLLFRTPEQCPSVVSLLSESYNPHVRYGSAMALGISCAGTGNKDAISLLEPMTNDPVNFVRQGALIATSLILIQQTEALCPKVKDFRAMYSKVISDKHDDVMAKFGAILAQGIIDAGGRNVSVSLQSRTGHTNLPAVVGMLIFTQFWYWFPLAHFISLAFTPTALIGLNSDLKMPKIEFKSNAKPSTYGYPPPLEEKKEKEREKVLTAVLSITAKAKKKEAEKKKEEKMDVDETTTTTTTTTGTTGSSSTSESTAAASTVGEKKSDEEKKSSESAKKSEDKDKKDKPTTTDDKATEQKSEQQQPPTTTGTKSKTEPNFEILKNPARVMPQQLKLIQMAENNRYEPIKDLSIGGIILMKDKKSQEPEDLVEPVQAGGPKIEEEREPDPPEPFEYVE